MQYSTAQEVVDLCSSQDEFSQGNVNCKQNVQKQTVERAGTNTEMFEVNCCTFGIEELEIVLLQETNMIAYLQMNGLIVDAITCKNCSNDMTLVQDKPQNWFWVCNSKRKGMQ